MKTKVASALLLFLAAALAAAQSPSQTPAQPIAQTAEEKAKQQATIEGQVLNQVTGEPVRKANLTLKPEIGGTNLKAISDNEGKFSIENIDAGRYTLAAERQGFVNQNYGARRPIGPGTPLDLKASQVMKGLVLKMIPQGVIAGRVLDDEGEPVSGVAMQVLQYRYVLGKKRLIGVVNTLVLTNDLGEFRAPNLSPGRYYVATTPQKIADIQSGIERSTTKGQTEGLIATYYPSAADPASASPVEVGPGAEVRGIDLRLRKARVFRISGKVVSAATGMAVSPSMIMVFRREAGAMSTMPASMYSVRGDKGEFELRNIAPGPYSMLAMSANPADLMLQMTTIDVTDQDIEGMVVALGAGLDIPVTTKIEGTPPPPEQSSSADAAKQPPAEPDLSAVRIVLNVEDNPLASLATTQLGKDGKGLLKRVNADNYRLIISGLPPGTYLKSARFADRDALASGLNVRQGGSGSLDLLIAAPAAELSGVVRNEKGDPVNGAIVTLVPKDAKLRTDMSRTGSADQNGNVRIRNLVPAEYKVFAWEDIETGAAEDEEFRKPFESLGTKVTLSEGSKESVQLLVITRAAVEEEKVKQSK